MTTRTKPPFRADHVGSLLRPAALKEARGQREKGAITAAELKQVERRRIVRSVESHRHGNPTDLRKPRSDPRIVESRGNFGECACTVQSCQPIRTATGTAISAATASLPYVLRVTSRPAAATGASAGRAARAC